MEQALTHPSRPDSGPAGSRPSYEPLDRRGLAGNSFSGWPAGAANAAPPTVPTSSAGGPSSVPEGPAGGSSESTPSGKPGVLSGSAVSWDNDAGITGTDADENEEETPGRSPLRHGASRDQAFHEPHSLELLSGGSDPLGEGLGLLAGIAIGLLTLVVPLLSVISDRSPGSGFSVNGNAGSGRLR